MASIQAAPRFSSSIPLRMIQFAGEEAGFTPGQGSKVRLWKQDPSVDAIGIRTAFIHSPVANGPSDDEITIQRMPQVKADADGNFLFDQKQNEKAFDAVHTYTVVRQVLTMFQRALRRMGVDDNFKWQWGDGAIKVYPHAGTMANAYYSRQQRSLKFFYFRPPNARGPEKVYTNRSFDIVSHEAGHAVLDGMRPDYLTSWHPQTGGLHESFGDLAAIFTMLAQLDQCEAIIAESKADLHDKSFFPAMAEEFGNALGRPYGLRNADNNLKMSDVSNEVHDISQVFTGAVYSILADVFEDSLKLDHEDPAMTLFKVGEHLRDLLIGALMAGPSRNATYKDIADHMIRLESNPKWKQYIKKRFTEREILGDKQKEITPGQLKWNHCCPTMRRPEHKKLVNEAIREARRLNLTG